MSKINKALDYNKLIEQQAKGKLLKKILQFPLIAQTKYDGNYVAVEVKNGKTTFTTSGGLNYTHTDDGGDCFRYALDGVYICERVAGSGKLGDRVRCNLRGPKANQTSTGHTYKVFDYLSLDDYWQGFTGAQYNARYEQLLHSGIDNSRIVTFQMIENKEQLASALSEIVKEGYEGLMLYQPDFKWRDTKSRTIDLCKYKKRPTADLLCADTTEGEGKYEGLIGSLVLSDSKGRTVAVGSGLSDSDRNLSADDFIGKVVEIEYEQILDTYVQPTFIQIRDDKAKEDID